MSTKHLTVIRQELFSLWAMFICPSRKKILKWFARNGRGPCRRGKSTWNNNSTRFFLSWLFSKLALGDNIIPLSTKVFWWIKTASSFFLCLRFSYPPAQPNRSLTRKGNTRWWPSGSLWQKSELQWPFLPRIPKFPARPVIGHPHSALRSMFLLCSSTWTLMIWLERRVHLRYTLFFRVLFETFCHDLLFHC